MRVVVVTCAGCKGGIAFHLIGPREAIARLEDENMRGITTTLKENANPGFYTKIGRNKAMKKGLSVVRVFIPSL